MNKISENDYEAKHDLSQIFNSLKNILTRHQPPQPIKSTLSCLQELCRVRIEEGVSVDDYESLFKSVVEGEQQSVGGDEIFTQFDWNGDEEEGKDNRSNNNNHDNNKNNKDERALREAPSVHTLDQEHFKAATKLASAGSPLNPAAYSAQRRFSISAEPYTPKANQHFERVVIKKEAGSREAILKAITPNLLFRNLDREQREQIIDAMFAKNVAAGETIIKQGEEGDFFYVIESGSVDCVKDGELLVTLGAGEAFGELALMYGSPRMATVIARKDCALWAVDRQTFRAIIIDLSYRKRLVYERFLKGVELFKTLMPNEILRICDALQPSTHLPGKSIVVEREEGSLFYILIEGEAEVIKDGEVVGRLSAGDYFGELALIKDEPRAATVRALPLSNDSERGVECVSLSKADFIRLLGPLMPILKRNEEQYAKYAKYLSK